MEVPQELDQSGLGVELKFLTSEQATDETTNFRQGIGVAKYGYGEASPLYRIYHDSVDENGYNPDDAIAVVLQNYEELLRYSERKHP